MHLKQYFCEDRRSSVVSDSKLHTQVSRLHILNHPVEKGTGLVVGKGRVWEKNRVIRASLSTIADKAHSKSTLVYKTIFLSQVVDMERQLRFVLVPFQVQLLMWRPWCASK